MGNPADMPAGPPGQPLAWGAQGTRGAQAPQRSRRPLVIGAVVLVVAVLFLSGLGAIGGGQQPAAPTQATSGVPWADHAPALQLHIDALAAGANCPALQEQFDNADANNDATMSRTGHNNAALMGYIDQSIGVDGRRRH